MQRNLALGGIAAVLLAAALFLFLRNREEGKLPSVYKTSGACLACGHDVNLTYGSTEVAPYKCPLCGQEAAYDWLYCRTCKTQFIPAPILDPAGGRPRNPVIPVCPNCGGTSTGAFDPADPEQTPERKAPLPKWK